MTPLPAFGAYRFQFETAEDILRFRQTHLWPDKPLSHVRVPGDDTALHIGAHIAGLRVGAASFFVDGPAAQLRKLAVDPDHRGQGLGAALVQRGAAQMRAKGLINLWCDARATALPFYQRLGFTIMPGTYLKSDLPYPKAILTL